MSSPAISITRTQSQKVCCGSNHLASGSNHGTIVCPKTTIRAVLSEALLDKKACCSLIQLKAFGQRAKAFFKTVSNTEELFCARL